MITLPTGRARKPIANTANVANSDETGSLRGKNCSVKKTAKIA